MQTYPLGVEGWWGGEAWVAFLFRAETTTLHLVVQSPPATGWELCGGPGTTHTSQVRSELQMYCLFTPPRSLGQSPGG